MTEISSFNEIFSEARRLGLRLNSFCQLADGSFRANWIYGEKTFGFAEHPLPFVALLNAFVLADLTAPKRVEPEQEMTDEQAAAHQRVDDLFA